MSDHTNINCLFINTNYKYLSPSEISISFCIWYNITLSIHYDAYHLQQATAIIVIPDKYSCYI